MSIKTYLFLTKPGIILGNAITAAGGFALASKGQIDLARFFATLLSLSLIIASACVFNNYIDRKADEKMARTKNRALAQGSISKERALFFGTVLGLLGTCIFLLFSTTLALAMALLGFFVYVILYSFLKYRTIHATLIGSIAGAIPPLVGYCAVSNQLDAGAFILFLMIALWQMPHFFAIAIYRIEDYAAVAVPLLPIKKGVWITKIHMLLYIAAFMGVCMMLVAFDYAGILYLIAAGVLGLVWFVLCLQGLKCADDQKWARKMFVCSLVVILGINISIPLSV